MIENPYRFFRSPETKPILVRICAWCYPPGTEPKLPEGQEYTHGICKDHKEKLMPPTKKPVILESGRMACTPSWEQDLIEQRRRG